MALTPLNVIGDIKNHDFHGPFIVTGKADFGCDRLPLVKLYGAIKSATISHGNIKSIDATKALAEPGVKAVITYKECPTWTQGVFYWGQDVAGVVADDPFTAARATTLIDVQYDVQSTIFDPDEAMKPGAPLSGARPDTNVATPTNLVRGDVAAGMAKADVQLETQQPWTTTYQHNMLELHSCIAWWVGDHLYEWGKTQNPHGAKSGIVNPLGMPAKNVHYFNHFCGGGHGDGGTTENVPAAVMSKAVNGAPVQLTYTRRQNIMGNSHQFSVRSNIKWGAKSDGTLTAVDAAFFGNCGSNPNAPVAGVNFGLKNTFKIPDAKMVVTSIVTNSGSRGYWRCVNDPPGAVNMDTALDKLADKLNLDPYALRLKNIIPADAPDQDPPNRVWGDGGAGNGVKAALEKVYSESGYASKWHKPGTKTLPDGRLHGIAITGHKDSHGSMMGGSRGAIVIMCPDGTCLVDIGGARGPSGPLNAMSHIVAEMVGLKYSDIYVGDWGNTDISLDGGMQAGSTFTASAGSAFYNAALDARNQLLAAAITKTGLKEIAGITAADVDAKDSTVFYTKDPTKKITFRQAMSGTPPIAGRGNGWNGKLVSRPIGTAKIGDACNVNGGAAACAEVAVDPDTGEVEVTGLWNAVDTGRTIFRQGAIKEMNSGNELMVWQALYAGDVYDATSAASIGGHYYEAMMMTTKDVNPLNFKVYDIESDDSAGPYGCHGIGEPCVTNYSAIVNAIFNATGKWVDMDKGPVTPNKVLKALGKA